MSNTFPTFDSLVHLTTLTDWVRFGASEMSRNGCFYGHGFDEAWSEARYLVLRSVHLDWHVPDVALAGSVTEKERHYLYEQLTRRCVEKIPTAYLVREAWFCGEPYYVTDSVLVPRSPIAELVEQRYAPWLSQPPTRILDLCTGSGCIGIASAMTFPEAKVDLSDLSSEAVRIAVENVSRKDLGYQINVFEGDLFESLGEFKYDLIVTNPPYVDAEDIESMPDEFHQEPLLGLAAGDDGLDIVHRILAQAPSYLTEHGWLICEVGNSANAITDAYPGLEFVWPEFEQGGHGIFVVSAKQLSTYFESTGN